jgi:hypothetical protein
LYGCETWFLTLREEHRFRVPQKIFGPKRVELVGGWRRLHNEELHNLYGSPNIMRVIKSRRMRWERHVTHMGEMRNSYKILVRKPEEKRPFRRWPRCRCEDNIQMDPRRRGWDGIGWMNLAQDRDKLWALVNMVMNLQVP